MNNDFKMKNTKILIKFIEEKKWEEILQFSINNATKNLFMLWLESQENKIIVNSFIQNLPNNYISPLIINFPSLIIPL